MTSGKDSLRPRPNTTQMTTVQLLFDLQRLDSRLAYLERAVSSLDDGSTLRAEVDQARADEEAARTDLHSRQSRLRALELELQSSVEKAHKVEHELYSGRVTNPKELTAMQQDLQALGRQREHLEDQILALMEEIEGLLQRLATLESQRAGRERALSDHLEEYRRREQSLNAELVMGRSQRVALVAEVEADLLRRYDRLRDRKDGVAVAAVVGGICEGCHVAVPEGRVADLLEEERIFTCEGCGRILYAKG